MTRQRLYFIENQNRVSECVKSAGVSVGGGKAGVKKLHEAGQNDVAVPAFGQTTVGIHFFFIGKRDIAEG